MQTYQKISMKMNTQYMEDLKALTKSGVVTKDGMPIQAQFFNYGIRIIVAASVHDFRWEDGDLYGRVERFLRDFNADKEEIDTLIANIHNVGRYN